MNSDIDRLSPRCFNPKCGKQFDSVDDMVAVPGRGNRSPRHFCEDCAERVRRGPPLTDGGQVAQPRKWSHGDENPVMCQHCGSTWAGNSLYKTGDVLRCPGCDGVMRP